MIDKKHGRIVVDDNNSIKPESSLKEILSLNLGQSRNQGNHNNGWTWLTERNANFDDKYFNFNFLFLDDKLKELHFTVNDIAIESKSWEDWAESEELLNLEKYKTWLAIEVGGQENFDWGDIWATYDPKSGGSSIIIRYK